MNASYQRLRHADRPTCSFYSSCLTHLERRPDSVCQQEMVRCCRVSCLHVACVLAALRSEDRRGGGRESGARKSLEVCDLPVRCAAVRTAAACVRSPCVRVRCDRGLISFIHSHGSKNSRPTLLLPVSVRYFVTRRLVKHYGLFNGH